MVEHRSVVLQRGVALGHERCISCFGQQFVRLGRHFGHGAVATALGAVGPGVERADCAVLQHGCPLGRLEITHYGPDVVTSCPLVVAPTVQVDLLADGSVQG